MLQLFINDKLCELTGGETIAIDLAMLDVKDFSKRKGLRSINFELPRTVNNSLALEVSEIVNNLTRAPYRKSKARLIEDGIDTGVRFCELVSIKATYSINLYGGNSNFFDIIKNKSIREVDLSAYNHIWNFDNIIASFTNTAGYIYPLIDYGSDVSVMGNIERKVLTRFLLPSVYLDTVLSRIISESGYAFVNQMQEVSEYTENPILVPTTDKYAATIKSSKYNAVFRQSTNINLYESIYQVVFNGGPFGIGEIHTTTPPLVSGQITGPATPGFVLRGVVPSYFAPNSPPPGQRFAPPAPVEQGANTGDVDTITETSPANEEVHRLDTIVSYSGSYYSVPYPYGTLWFEDNFPIQLIFKLEIKNDSTRNSTVRMYIETDGIRDTLGIGPVRAFFMDLVVLPGLNAFTLPLNYNDSLQVELGGPPTTPFVLSQGPDVLTVSYLVMSGGAVTIRNTSTIEVKSGFEDELTNQFVYGSRIELSRTLPDIKQSELLKDYCQMFCLVPIVNEIDKIITLRRFDDISKSNPIDWSNKLDIINTPELKFLVDEYGRNSHLLWDKEDDEPQPVGTNGVIEIDNDNLPLSVDVVKLNFASTISQLKQLNIPVPKISIFESGEFKKDAKPRLLILTKQLVGSLYGKTDLLYSNEPLVGDFVLGEFDLAPICRFIDESFLYNLGFDNSLLRYYGTIKGMLSDYKNINCFLRLNASDITNIDFFKQVYIKEFNAYFYVSNISGYEPGQSNSTEVELVKLY